jgi:hypothetical protein
MMSLTYPNNLVFYIYDLGICSQLSWGLNSCPCKNVTFRNKTATAAT